MLEKYQQDLNVKEESFRAKWRRMLAGLRAPKDSGEYKRAKLAMQRLCGPSSASTSACALVLLLLLVFLKIAVDTEPTELEVTIVEPDLEEIDEILEEIEPEIVEEEVVDMVPRDVEDIVTEVPSVGDDTPDG